MVPERYRELLTAYVDGELSNRQRKAALRLLRRSPEARALLRRLQEDAAALRRLPRPSLDRDLSGPVVEAIRARRLQPGGRPRPKLSAPAALPSWLGLAAAAAVLLVLGVTSYVYFAHSVAPSPVAGGSPAPGPEAPGAADEDETAGPRPEVVESPRPGPAPVEDPGTAVVQTPPEPAPAQPSPEAPAPDDAKLASHLRPPFVPRTVKPSLHLLLDARELGESRPQADLRDYLAKGDAYRIELHSRDGHKAAERWQSALRAAGLGVVTDGVAAARLKQPRIRSSFAVYADGLTREEWAHLLGQLAAADRQAEGRRAGDGLFGALVVSRMNDVSRKELADWLGVEPGQLTPPRPAGDLDPTRPLSEGTADQVVKALAGQGGAPRPAAGKPAAKGPVRQALLLAPARPAAPSPEVKRFLDGRGSAKEGAVQVVLVLRATGV